MAQGDYLIQNQTFPSFRTDLNSTLEAINTSNSGTSRPSSAVAGTIWLDTTSATTPTLKFYDGADESKVRKHNLLPKNITGYFLEIFKHYLQLYVLQEHLIFLNFKG